ncbi:MAG: hypothetical protein K2Q22_13095 [Cytophagales bacterium]|nr:hypothetical protein [Cytophagales bacterium]
MIFFASIEPGAAQQNQTINQLIVQNLQSLINTQVGRGECWDLADKLLTDASAKWTPPYVYGKAVNPMKDSILAGDMIQFEGIKLEYEKDGAFYKESMEHHTAVVYKVIDKGKYLIAHQNNAYSGRKVGVSELQLPWVKKGKMYFYRPEKL